MISNGAMQDFLPSIPLHTARHSFHHTNTTPYLAPSLATAKQVYIRRDGTKSPLQRPFTGPYSVLASGDKTFLLDIGGRAEWISVDRLKPAFSDPLHPTALAKPPPRGRPPVKSSQPHGRQSSRIQKKSCLNRSPNQLFQSDNTSLLCSEMASAVRTLQSGRVTRLPSRYQ